MARGLVGLFRCIGVTVALVTLVQFPVASQSLPPTAWGPPEDPALISEQADQSYMLKAGEGAAVFTFRIFNVSKEDVDVLNVFTSCSCATPKLPSTPWRIGSGETGQFQIVMTVQGKTGTVVKTAAIETRKGVRPLSMTVMIPTASGSTAGGTPRDKNMQVAAADRQAVFRGDCATCHVTRAVGLMGQPLYAAACGICHEAEHRASMVPNLRTLEHPTNREFWVQLIAQGKAGTLMPAFALEYGGPLSGAQIESLAKFLSETYSPLHPAKGNSGQKSVGSKW